MPLTDEQKAAIALLKDVPEGDLPEAVTELQTQAQPVFQTIFRKGFGTAKDEYEGTDEKPGKLTKVKAELTTAQQRAQQLEGDLAEARKNQPDVEKIHADWQTKYDNDLAAAKAEAEAERKARAAEREARRLADLRAELGAIQDPEYAEFLASKHVGRLALKDDGSVVLHEAGSVVPVQIPAGTTPYRVLAADILKTVAPDKKKSDVDTGGGVNGGAAGPDGYDPVKAGREMAEQQKATAGAESLAFK